MTRKAAAAGLLSLMAMATAPAATAQSASAGLGAGGHYQHFSFGDARAVGIESLSLLSVPIGARLQPFDRLTIEAGSRWARGELTRPDGSTSTIEGFTDTNITASISLGDDVAEISAIAALPTGKSSYQAEEIAVAGAVSADLLPFRVSNWGSGGGLGLRTSASWNLGAVGAALSVGYFRSGEFDPVAGELVAYRPGNRLSVRAAMDAPVGAAGEFGLQVGFKHHTEDELQGQNLFRSGDRFEIIGSYSFAVGARSAGTLYGGYHRREKGTHLQGLDPVPARDLLLAGTSFRIRLGSVLLRPSVDGRLLERPEASGEGWHLRGGLQAELPAGTVTFVPTVRGHLGDVTVRSDQSSGYSGLEAGLNLRFGSTGG